MINKANKLNGVLSEIELDCLGDNKDSRREIWKYWTIMRRKMYIIRGWGIWKYKRVSKLLQF